MVTTETCIVKDYTSSYTGNLKTVPKQDRSQIASYLDSLYSYPPKIKLKWTGIDEFTSDLLLESNYGVLEHSFPFLDFIENWFFNDQNQNGVSKTYSLSQYVDGYLNKITSTNFYKKGTKPIQNALKGIPIFVVLNGNGEIVLNKPSKNLGPKNFQNIVNEKIYDFCGSFDSSVEARQALGLFFLNRLDAETYLKALAQTDIDGTQTLGLTVNCIGLDSAYKITREHHPGVDLRIVPNLSEVQNFLSKHIKSNNIIVEDEQQQLRFRPRSTKVILPFLGKLSLRLSQSFGAHSFVQANEYFKGTPIYVVQINEEPRNLIVENYFNLVGLLDTGWGKINQSIDRLIGLGDNAVLQGSLDDENPQKGCTNYVFFDKTQASQFIKQQGNNVRRYSGAKMSSFASKIRKPKIFIHNLEDFLETWEDTLNDKESTNVSSIYGTTKTIFVPSETVTKDILVFKNTQTNKPLKKILQSFDLKTRVLKRNLAIFFSVE